MNLRKKEIRLFLTDCDGCLTDGGMYYTEQGDELKKFHTRDGFGFFRLHEAGIKTGMLTAENTKLNQRRGEKLRLDYIFQGCLNKAEKIKAIAEELNIPLENIAYLGDDYNDLGAMALAGLSFTPADGIEEAKEIATHVLKTKGGCGCVREAAEIILGPYTEKNRP